MYLKDRQRWIRWIESIPSKRDKSKKFSQDDDFFWAELQKGLLYERLVAKILQDEGISPIQIASDNFQFRENIGEAKKYAKNGKDLIIKGHNFEVKSRNIGFTSPQSWPRKCLPIHIDTVDSIDSKNFDVVGYIFISQRTGALIGISMSTKDQWEIHDGADNIRNFKEKFYSADPKYFYDEPTLIRSLKRMSRKNGKPRLLSGIH